MRDTLDLVLKEKWYRMIESGEKTEEYREIKPFWEKRMQNCRDRHYDKVTFHLGYSKDRPSMTFALDKITIDKGRPEWGAEEGKLYFVIHLGKRLSCHDTILPEKLGIQVCPFSVKWRLAQEQLLALSEWIDKQFPIDKDERQD